MKPLVSAAIRPTPDSGTTPHPGSTARAVTNLVTTVPQPSRLWLWFVAAFVIQFAAWTAWFVIAAHHQVEDVPVATGVRK